jgi:hypothetical protein
MPRTGRGSVAVEAVRVLGVVVDQQPALPSAKLLEQQHDLLLQVTLLGEAEATGKCAQPAAECRRLLGRDPPDQVVVGGEAVGILDSKLALANAAKPVHGAGLHQRSGRCVRQGRPEGAEQVVAAGEVGVAWRGR